MTNTNFRKVRNLELKQNILRKKALKKGVKIPYPNTVYLSKDTKFGSKVTIEPYVVIGPKVKIGSNVIIKSFTYIEGARIDNDVTIGPYSRIRPGTKLLKGSRVGNFVETKNSIVKSNSKINHLSYIGDTKIGKNSNIGAGTITCNYDGVKKNKTKIKDNVFVGSNTSLVAPVTLEKNSTIGAGSVITQKVKKNSLAISRSNQKEIKNYKRKKRI